MPEEKKKESFTFSDKIKNSKPIASKSFANRISSKIGSNGKPKKTLFERTKRDAPFFIAALIALLLLPFLYKYSGQVNEEVMVTPGSEESIFDPERYGFDTVTGDPDGQVALFSGRDPLSWIITGSKSTQPEEDSYDSQIYTDRSGMDDSSSYNDTTVEENNTNIYKQNAPAATRAAFRRAATKINPLSSAGLTSRSGGKLGVGMWGGGLKTAAGFDRIIPIAECIFPFIKAMYNPERRYLFPDESGKELSYNNYCRKFFEPAMIKLNLDHLPHDGRHTCASALDRAEVNPVIIRRILGHRAKDITEKVYIHKYIPELVEAANKQAVFS